MGRVQATSLAPWVGSGYGKTRPEPDPLPFLNRWDKDNGAARGLQASQEVQLEENQTNISLAGGLSKPWENAKSADTLSNGGPCSERSEKSSPTKALNETSKESHPNGLGLNLEAVNEPIFRGKWKKNC